MIRFIPNTLYILQQSLQSNQTDIGKSTGIQPFFKAGIIIFILISKQVPGRHIDVTLTSVRCRS